MIESRIPRARLILGTLAALLLAACGDATESSPGKSHSQRERELQPAEQNLEQSREALVAAERRLFPLAEEQTRDRRRIADLTASSAALERRNRELGQQLAQARGQLAQSGSLQKTLREQRDQNARRVREIRNEHQAMQGRLARAHGEVRRLQARQAPGQRQITDPYHRGAVATRELAELRRYNGFLLQERSNLQAWLAEANATRNQQRDALHRSRQEADHIKSSADAANQRLRVELEKANQALAELETSRDALTKETHSLRAAVTRTTEAERSRSEQLERALAHARTLADAHDRMSAELQSSRSALDQQREQQGNTIGAETALRAELEQATSTIAKLRTARDYLVEKIEACALQQQSSRADSMEQAKHLARILPRNAVARWPCSARARFAPSTIAMAMLSVANHSLANQCVASNPCSGAICGLALPSKLLRSRSETVSRRQSQDRFMTAHWQPGPAIEISRPTRLIPVATQTDEQPRSTRREKELNEARKKVEELEQEQEALTKKLQDLETECAAVKKQVQTLTWANEVLVKELDAAYEARKAGKPGSLPKGTRGIYVLRKGESLSRVANAFYGDPKRWKDLVEANKDKIPDPNMVKAGTVILIPE